MGARKHVQGRGALAPSAPRWRLHHKKTTCGQAKRMDQFGPVDDVCLYRLSTPYLGDLGALTAKCWAIL